MNEILELTPVEKDIDFSTCHCYDPGRILTLDSLIGGKILMEKYKRENQNK